MRIMLRKLRSGRWAQLRKKTIVSTLSAALVFGGIATPKANAAAPVVINPIPDQHVEYGTTSVRIPFSGVFSDADGDLKDYSVWSMNRSVADGFRIGNEIHLNIYQQGTVEITLTASDSQGNTVTDRFFVTISDTRGPNLTIYYNNSVPRRYDTDVGIMVDDKSLITEVGYIDDNGNEVPIDDSELTRGSFYSP